MKLFCKENQPTGPLRGPVAGLSIYVDWLLVEATVRCTLSRLGHRPPDEPRSPRRSSRAGLFSFDLAKTQAADVMASIVAEQIVSSLEAANFVVMRRPGRRTSGGQEALVGYARGRPPLPPASE